MMNVGGRCKYDVFISFRGTDTRKIFVGHLYRALQHKAINAFVDSEGLSKGNNISELLTCIEESKLSILVLSQNYASSTWCLKELAKIVDCVNNKKQMVLPVFYQVDPSDLRRIKGTFAEAFAKHGENLDIDKEELGSWRSALISVADLSGWDSTKYEDDGKLIEEIVESTLKKLIHTSSNKLNGLVGMDSHIAEMSLRLGLEVNDVRVVGIWGMGGIGKTTIGRAVYDEIACQFEHSCFLNNVKEAFISKREVELQEELLSTLLKEKEQSVGLNRGRNMIMEMLHTKKVLVVLDDVETFAQIETLLGELHALGKGSRVIITTRNKQSLSGVNVTYEPKCLSDDKALKLFRKYAFRTANQQKGNYNDLARLAIKYARGLPLALKVLGAFLDNKSICEWKAVLEKLKKIPHVEIQDVLRTSFDGLDDLEKDIFLDIACLFRKWKRSFVTELLDSFGFFPHNGLRVLVDRALITIDYRVDMHDLLQEMGHEVVRLECAKNPGKRSRSWSYEDVNHILTQNSATDAVECLMLDLSSSKVDVCINTEAFARMTNLRLVMIYYSSFFPRDYYGDDCFDSNSISPVGCCKQLARGNLEFLSQELRFILWHGCPLKSLPSTFIPKNLVKLDMRGSHLQQLWKGIKPLQNLKVIKLSNCQNLVKIPDLTEAINLEKLYLDGCSSLFEVHSSISELHNLHLLTLEGCNELKILPRSIHMKSLDTLLLSGCSNLEKFPEISGIMKELTELCVNETTIVALSSSIENLKGLVTLSLKDCRELKSLPGSICQLKSLKYIVLSGSSNFEEFPNLVEDMEGLKELHLDGTSVKELLPSIERLKRLVLLNMRNCRSLVSLPDSICNLAYLKELYLAGCSQLYELPESLGNLASLRDLEVKGSSIKQLPSSVVSRPKKLRRVSYDHYDECREKTTPCSSWPSSIEGHGNYAVLLLDLSDRNLLGLSDAIALFASLKTLKLCRNSFESLPVKMNQLRRLTHLKLEGCKRLKSIPQLSSSIRVLDAHDCTALETVLTPMPGFLSNLCFTFSNCYLLAHTNLFRDMVENHSPFQDNLQRSPSFIMCLAGSEIPEWFSYQCIGYSVTAHLPPNCFHNMLSGFAVCAVASFKCAHYASDLSVECIYTFKRSHGEFCMAFNLLDWNMRTDRFLESDHMFLGYMPMPSEEEWCRIGPSEQVTEATFEIVVQNGVYSRDIKAPVLHNHSIKCCGVRFFYFNQEEVHHGNNRVAHEDFGKPMIAVSNAKKSHQGYCYDVSPDAGGYCDFVFPDAGGYCDYVFPDASHCNEGEGEGDTSDVEQNPKRLGLPYDEYISANQAFDPNLDEFSSSGFD